MNIAIPAEHANANQLTGVEHYTRELICGLGRIDDRNKYTLYFQTEPGSWCRDLPANFIKRVIPARVAWTQTSLSWHMVRDRPDALLVTSFSMPLLHPRNSVVTIHDLAWHLFPDSISIKQRSWLLFTHHMAARLANRLIAVSHQTKTDIVKVLKVQPSRINVIHHGFSQEDSGDASSTQTPSASSELAAALAKIGKPFILSLGTLQPRKNLSRLIDAFLLLKQHSSLPHALVLAGRAGWMCEDLLEKIKTSLDVVYLGYVDDRLGLLRAADLLVQPAIYEGFGLSLLDAFSQGIPVACSDVSSLPEVAGGAAELFDPYSTKSMADAMLNVLVDPGRAEQLRQRGTTRLDFFSWDDCARRTLAVLEAGDVPHRKARTRSASRFDTVPN